MKKAFTIVEVLVVIGIIAILTVLIFPSINDIRAKNRDAERVSDIAAIQLGLSLYYNQHQTEGYPTSLDLLAINNKYVTLDSLTTPEGEKYLYVPLALKTPGKCIYYHLGVELELPSAQIDSADNFSSIEDNISNNYIYCTGVGGTYSYGDGGIDGIYSNNNLMYDVHP